KDVVDGSGHQARIERPEFHQDDGIRLGLEGSVATLVRGQSRKAERSAPENRSVPAELRTSDLVSRNHLLSRRGQQEGAGRGDRDLHGRRGLLITAASKV